MVKGIFVKAVMFLCVMRMFIVATDLLCAAAPQYCNPAQQALLRHGGTPTPSYATEVPPVSEGESVFIIHNASHDNVWARVNILTVESTFSNRINVHGTAPQVLYIPAGGNSGAVVRRRFDNKVSLSFWRDAACTDRIILGINASINGLMTDCMQIAGVHQVDLIGTIDSSSERHRLWYNVELHRNFTDFDCPICLETKPKERIMVFSCGHKVHEDCGWNSIINYQQCPICRKPIDPTREYNYDRLAGDFVIYTQRNKSAWGVSPVDE